MPRPEEELITILKKQGVDFTASLPCEKIKTLLEMVGRDFMHLPLTREEEGVGICAGAALAGRRPAMFVQSSGIGNMINALLSLSAFYELPLALFISRRGFYKEKIEAQFPMGQKLPAILAGAGITYSKLNTRGDIGGVERELQEVYEKGRIHAFLMSPEVWEGSDCGLRIALCTRACTRKRWAQADCGIKESSPKVLTLSGNASSVSEPTLTRFDIIETIAPYLQGKVVVSNLGWPSKELYAILHQPSNFYMLGSMGMAAPIGLGIALASSKEVVVIDGDGSLLMNPGTLATAAFARPKNLTILAIDNSAYGSTGNQPTLTSACVDLEQVARGFGFSNTVKLSSAGQLTSAMKNPGAGPTFIQVLARPGNRDVPNIPVHHLEVKKQVREFLLGQGAR